jgi:hypothetical protein
MARRREQNAEIEPDVMLPVEAQEEIAAPVDQGQPQVIPPASEWTVNGMRVQDLHPQVQQVISWRMTDQFLQAAADRPGPRPMVEVISNAEDKRLQRYADEWDGVDPMQEIISQHKEPGKRYRFISKNHRAGKRRWELVRDPKTGDTPAYNNMLLASMPEERAQARQRYHEGLATDSLKSAVEQHKLDQEKAIRDSRSGGNFGTLSEGDLLVSSDDPSRAGSIGIRVTRGAGADAAALI